jgi:hypothetical protein
MASNSSSLAATPPSRRSPVVKLDISHSRASSIRGLDTLFSDVEQGETGVTTSSGIQLHCVHLSLDRVISSNEHQYTTWEKLKLRSGYYFPGTSFFACLICTRAYGLNRYELDTELLFVVASIYSHVSRLCRLIHIYRLGGDGLAGITVACLLVPQCEPRPHSIPSFV